MYNFVLMIFKAEERTNLGQFIDQALDKCHDDNLMRLWDSVDSDIYFPTAKDLRAMLMGARERLR